MPSSRERGPKHLVIPDMQIRPDDDLSHVSWAARYAALKRPNKIIQLGDWGDFPSLSSYDEGTGRMEGRRYQDDVDVVNQSIRLFMRELKKHGPRSWSPELFFIPGNHENRIDVAVNRNPKLEGTMSLSDLEFKENGWRVGEFLRPVTIDGIVYAHYFPIGPKGRVTNSKHGAPSAEAQARRMMRSCTAGHRQGLDVAIVHTPVATYRGLIAGSYYQHEEDYLTPMGTNYWRGILVKHDVRHGEYNLMEVDLDYLRRRFG